MTAAILWPLSALAGLVVGLAVVLPGRIQNHRKEQS